MQVQAAPERRRCSKLFFETPLVIFLFNWHSVKKCNSLLLCELKVESSCRWCVRKNISSIHKRLPDVLWPTGSPPDVCVCIGVPETAWSLTVPALIVQSSLQLNKPSAAPARCLMSDRLQLTVWLCRWFLHSAQTNWVITMEVSVTSSVSVHLSQTLIYESLLKYQLPCNCKAWC